MMDRELKATGISEVIRFSIALINSNPWLSRVWNRGLNNQNERIRYLAFVGLSFVAFLFSPTILFSIRNDLVVSRRKEYQREDIYECDRTLYRLIEEYDVISFDIFDTLIIRNLYHPTDLFKVMEKVFGLKDFARIRLEAEKRANKVANSKGRANANLKEIYDAMEFSKGLGHGEIELDMESRFCEHNRTMWVLYRHAIALGKTVILTSDTYFSQEEMLYLLQSCGYTSFNELFLSSLSNYSKRDGSIFALISNRYPKSKYKVLHIGDNEISDHIMPELHGIDSFHYRKGSDRFPRLLKSDSEVFNIISNGIVSNCLLEKTSYFFELGVSVFGPLYYSFIQWIRRSAEEEGIENLYFLSRDGYLMKKVYDCLGGDNSQYLYVSRLVVKRALLGIHGIDSEKIIDQNISGIPLVNLASLLVPVMDIGGLQGTRFERAKVDVGQAELNRDFIEFLQCKNLDYLASQLSLLLRYFDMVGMTRHKTIGIVDIGWNGRIQDGLQTLFESCGINTRIIGHYVGIEDHPANRQRSQLNLMKGYAFFLERPEYTKELYEDFFTAPHGSVLGYEARESSIIPVLDSDGIEQPNLPKFEEFQKGVLWYIDCIKKYSELLKEIPRKDCLSLIETLTRQPTAIDLEEISDLVHKDAFSYAPSRTSEHWVSSRIRRIIWRRSNRGQT